jgi:catechol 2,3-dioxygenase-like lactoylglutathione lyase family enzyme
VKLSQVRMLADDFPACFRFYRDVLGLEPTFGGENDGYASFGNVALFERAGQESVVELRAAGDGALVCLDAGDLDAVVERVTTAGGEFLGPPVARSDWGIRVRYLRDPAGNLVEVHEEIPMEEG